MEYKIEKGIPIPTRRSGITATLKAMQVGESVFIPDLPIGGIGGVLSKLKQKTGARFTQKSIDGGVRVWRIE